MEVDLKKILPLAEEREEDNLKFRAFLKMQVSSSKVDAIVQRLYAKYSTELDCTQCGNCCREAYPLIKAKDVSCLSKGLGISNAEFKAKYLKKDDDGDLVFREKPCSFLENNRCTQYLNRPQDCRSYPHLQKREFTTRLFGVIANYVVCPIVYNVYEDLKMELGWQRKYR